MSRLTIYSALLVACAFCLLALIAAYNRINHDSQNPPQAIMTSIKGFIFGGGDEEETGETYFEKMIPIEDEKDEECYESTLIIMLVTSGDLKDNKMKMFELAREWNITPICYIRHFTRLDLFLEFVSQESLFERYDFIFVIDSSVCLLDTNRVRYFTPDIIFFNRHLEIIEETSLNLNIDSAALVPEVKENWLTCSSLAFGGPTREMLRMLADIKTGMELDIAARIADMSLWTFTAHLNYQWWLIKPSLTLPIYDCGYDCEGCSHYIEL